MKIGNIKNIKYWFVYKDKNKCSHSKRRTIAWTKEEEGRIYYLRCPTCDSYFLTYKEPKDFKKIKKFTDY